MTKVATYIPSRAMLHRVNKEGGAVIESKKILSIIEAYFNTTIEIMIGKSRKRECLYPRQVAMYLMAHYSCMTLTSIGIIFNRDHTTVIHSLESMDCWIQTDELVKNQISELIEKIKSWESI